ncbi:IclR family transcriptional regulator [Aquabacter cavernae]|uniref:IclR family transcriptional regulator n=1 Tax=Aquabacter cavernae TaxID=2496029 RepID=UPI000F8D9ABF|nr:IclR family transcriptional regulator [Aquabacter cavernae]
MVQKKAGRARAEERDTKAADTALPEVAAPERPEERDNASAMLRALDLLGEIARSETALSVPDLCARLALPKPTVHRLCQKLEAESYLLREPDGRRFAVGPRFLRMGFDMLRNTVSAERRGILEELVALAGETCNFVTRVGSEAIYLDRVEASWPLRLHLEVGSRVPMHCTASGKLFLASMRPAQRRRILESLHLKVQTPNTITTVPALEAELERISARGYSTDDQEFLEGLCAIAVPVRDAGGTVVAAVACHGPLPRFSLEKAVSLVVPLQRAAEKLARTLPE